MFFSSSHAHTLTRYICETGKASHSCEIKAKPHTQPIFTLEPHVMFLICDVLKEHQGHFWPLLRDFPTLMTPVFVAYAQQDTQAMELFSEKDYAFGIIISFTNPSVMCTLHPEVSPYQTQHLLSWHKIGCCRYIHPTLAVHSPGMVLFGYEIHLRIEKVANSLVSQKSLVVSQVWLNRGITMSTKISVHVIVCYPHPLLYVLITE